MRSVAIAVFLFAVAFPVASHASAPLPKQLQGIGIDQKLNAQVPLGAQFADESGRQVTLGGFLGKRPAILALVYYTCPALCNEILNGLVRGLRPLSLEPGRDFDVIAISINPEEDPAVAAPKRQNYVRMYSKNGSTNGWHFLTGAEPNIRAVADAVGFRYRYDPAARMFLHGAGITILTPEGKASRYLYGVDYQPKDLKLGLIEASRNRIGSPVDRILLFCYRYDALAGKYTATVLNILHVAGAVFLFSLIGLLAFLWRSDRRLQRGPSLRAR